MNRIHEPNHNKMQKSNRRDLLERKYFSLLSKWMAYVDGCQIIFVFGMEHQKQIQIMTKANATK
ncbi:hypothetical protein ACEYW6_17650 [Nostoc sp. UIC 10607]|uniref:hypothetical protein n=1 Tax=Nostoc sp. UIC 10607 TaxID=3045935 RepID=UPI00399FE1AF